LIFALSKIENTMEDVTIIERCLLKSETVQIDPILKTFDPQEHFYNGPVRYWFTSDFERHLLKPIQMPFSDTCISRIFLDKHFVKRGIYHHQIIENIIPRFFSEREILWLIANLTSKQPSGEPGQLDVSGNVNFIGYWETPTGLGKVACVSWREKKWCCHLEALCWCARGDIVFLPHKNQA